GVGGRGFMRVLIAILASLLLALYPATAALSGESTEDFWAHFDPPSSDNQSPSATVGGSRGMAGDSGSETTEQPASPSAEPVAWTPPPGIPPWVVPVERCVAQGDIAADCTAARPGTPAAPPPADAAPGTPGITIRDVASFRPELATLSSEPNGWAVRGLDANILATGGSSIRTGEFFGTVAEVRFTPVAYLFDYGDGSAPLSTSTPGATWAALGLDEFDPTPTSHVYTASGPTPSPSSSTTPLSTGSGAPAPSLPSPAPSRSPQPPSRSSSPTAPRPPSSTGTARPTPAVPAAERNSTRSPTLSP
ncbi:MAG: hypothetical protein U1C73_22170, partial [Dietzia sp.]|nr:hypothetical protein [Dietzia sp.]